jgi:hypothetical protein
MTASDIGCPSNDCRQLQQLDEPGGGFHAALIILLVYLHHLPVQFTLTELLMLLY